MLEVKEKSERITRPVARPTTERAKAFESRGRLDGGRPRSRKRIPRLGPYSKAIDKGAIGLAIDGRSREGRYVRAFERLLTEHIGGHANVAQQVLISRAARVALHLELMDERALRDNNNRPWALHDFQWYTAWSNCLARLIRQLGIKPGVNSNGNAPRLADYLNGDSG